MSFLFGDGGRSEARRQAEISRQQQMVANNRQLAELSRRDQETGLTRRRPRGRRLFADASSNQLKETLA